MDNLAVIILALSLIIIMLGMGLSLTIDDFKRVFKYPKAIFIGLSNQLILLPLIGFTLTIAFNLRPEIAIGLMILSACPGGATSNLITHLAKGDTALSVSLTAVSSLLSTITIPFIVNFALSYHLNQEQLIQLPILQTIAQIFGIAIIPVCLGMLIKYRFDSFAQKMDKPVKLLSAIVLALVIIGIILKERAHMGAYFEEAGIASYTLNISSMLLGFISARVLSLSKRQARSIAIETGIQNGTMAITIGTVLLNNVEYSIAPAIYSILMFFSGILVILVSYKKKEIA